MEKTILEQGNGVTPKRGDLVAIHYAGWVLDDDKADKKGAK